MTPEISVIIPTYNRVRLLEACLEALERQTFPHSRFEVIVVDDGSRDATRKRLGQKKFSYSLRVFFQQNGGAARARNRGIAESLAPVLVFTDDDCLPDARFLEAHAEGHSRGERHVVRGPIILIQSLEEAGGKKPGLAHRSANFFCTSNASVARDALKRAGSFSEEFGRWEDAELGYRLRQLGLTMRFVRDAAVYHVKPPWRLESLVRVARLDGRGARKLFEKHKSLRSWLAAGLHPASIGAGILLRPLVSLITSRMAPDSVVSGIWERLIFHSHFVEGLRS